MFRALLVIPFLVTACGKSAGSQDKDTAPVATGAPDKVTPPTGGPGDLAHAGGEKGPAIGNAGGGGSTLHDDEGKLDISKAEGKVGSELTSNITVTPASEFHVNTDFPTKITLEPVDGVKLMKTEFTAGGSAKAQGDAATFSEKSLAFAVKATADKPGAYEIKGTFKFAVCKVDQCFPKKQPITITVAAN
ncbi:MAG: hypothetical protein QM831_41270 [Kofleriaceae bacterium]